jgi:glutaredoxin 2
MLPIMDIDGTAMNESLDIIRALDSGNKLANEDYGDFDLVLDKLAPDIYNLAMPFWIWSPEFTPSAQRYFLKKKEIKRGPFSELIKRRNHFEANLTRTLQELEVHLNPFFNSSRLTVKDIALAAQVWGLFSVPEFRFSQKWHDYLMEVKGQCRFNYTEFHWRNP